MSAKKVRRRLQKHVLPLCDHGFVFPLDYIIDKNAFNVAFKTTRIKEWCGQWFQAQFRFCLHHHKDCISVYVSWGKHVTACIRRPPITGQSLGVMVCMFRSPFIRIDRSLNNGHYISVVLILMALDFIWVLRNATFQQDNALPHVICIVRTFLDTENTRLLPEPALSPDLSDRKRLANYCWVTGSSPYDIIIVDKLWHLVKLYVQFYLYKQCSLCTSQYPDV